jgi:MFS family permease
MAERALRRFCWLYPIANAGAFVAFLPLLTFIVPLRAAEIVTAGKYTLLSEALIWGVLVATIANVAAGVASDWTHARWGTRLPWVWAGLVGSWLSYGAINLAASAIQLILAVVAFQVCFNIWFGPLTVLFADKVPDYLKARVSAYANLALPAGSLATALVGLPVFTSNGSRIAVLMLLTAALTLPLLIGWPGQLIDVPDHPTVPKAPTRAGLTEFWSLWLARFFVQLSGNIVPSYFLFYLQAGSAASISQASSEFAIIITVSTGATALASIMVARWSDRSGRRKPFLLGAVALMAIGVVALIAHLGWPTALVGYTLFCSGLGTFQSVNIALVAQSLSAARHRGRDMGMMNIANTLPAMLGPLIALIILDEGSGRFPALFTVLLVTLGAGALALVGNRTLR